nr:MAG TPA: hypothetical protein [Caudoviricetes sp.]DAN13988.1 MAG TPA: hypothetical protein [Caudoviricetes sp.]
MYNSVISFDFFQTKTTRLFCPGITSTSCPFERGEFRYIKFCAIFGINRTSSTSYPLTLLSKTSLYSLITNHSFHSPKS